MKNGSRKSVTLKKDGGNVEKGNKKILARLKQGSEIRLEPRIKIGRKISSYS